MVSLGLASLVERYYGAVLGYLYRLAQGNRPLAEDLTQETFSSLLHQGSYVPQRRFKPWLYAIISTIHQGTAAHYRVFGTPAPQEAAQPVEPGLEEGYMWLMRTRHGENGKTLVEHRDQV
jgi:hypothetical protein